MVDRSGDGAAVPVRWRRVGLFVALAYGLAWLAAAPLHLSGQGLAHPFAFLLVLVMMMTPAIAALVVVLPGGRAGLATRLGLRTPGGLRRWWRWGLLAWLLPPLLTFLALLVAAAAGAYTPDLTGFGGFREALDAAGAGALPVPVGTIVLVQLVQLPLLGWINVLPALGEELGWRGYLVPALAGLGPWPAVLLSGAVWGAWHTPVLLLGYNYPSAPPALAVLLMTVSGVVLGVALGWLRILSGSVWPPAIAHAFVNASAGLPVLLAAAGRPVDAAQVGLIGWSGWLVVGLVVAVAALRLRRGARAEVARPAP